MANIVAYLALAGNCREAMNFYKECFGGELSMQTIGESPVASQMPAEEKNKIMHANLTKGDLVILASDMTQGKPVQGNTVSLCLLCTSEEEINTLFSRLSSGGKINDPLADTFWGAKFGTLTDKYGFNWMLNYDKPKA